MNWPAVRRSVLIAAIYLVVFTILDWLTRAFQIFPGVVPWYPPDGLSFALLLALGEGFTPALAIASLISSFLIYRLALPPIELIGWALAISLTYGLAAAFLRRRLRIDPQLRSMRDVLGLILSTMIVAVILTLISVPSLIASGTVPPAESFNAIIQWWIGETVGVLVVTPALLIHVMPLVRQFVKNGWKLPRRWKPFRSYAPRHVWQVVSILVTLFLTFSLRAFWIEYDLIFLIALPMLWIALDTGLAGISLGILAINFGTTFALFAAQVNIEQMAELQFLMLGVSVSGLLTGVVVSERKQAKQSVGQSEKRFRSLIENGLDSISLLNAEGLLIWESPAVTPTLDYSPNEFLGRSIFELVHPDDLESTRCLFAEVLGAPGGRRHAILRLRHHDGSWRWVEGVSTNLLNEPAVQAVVINYRDITERKQAEATLRESEQRFRWLFTTSPDAIVLIDPHDPNVSWPIVDCNEAACRMNGYTREELIGHSVNILNLSPGSPEERAAYLDQMRRERVMHIETFHRHKDGHVFPIEVSTSLFNSEGRELVLGIDRDITERKQAEAKLRESEANLAAAQHITHLGSWELDLSNLDDLNLNSLHLSDEVFRIFGYELGGIELTNENFFRAVHPEDHEKITMAFAAALKDGAVCSVDYRIIRSDGTERIVHQQSEIVFNEKGTPVKMVGTIQDVTEARHAEQALLEAETRYRLLVERLPAITYVITTFGHSPKTLYISPQVEQILGFTPEEWLADPGIWERQIHPEDLERVLAEDQASREQGRAFICEYRIRRRDGRITWLHDETHYVKEPDLPLLVQGIEFDITERKLAEEALQRAEKKYHNIFENAMEGIYQTTPEGRYITANPAQARMLGYDTPEQLITGITDLNRQFYVDPDRRAEFESKIEEFGMIVGFKSEIYHKDGSTMWISENAHAVRDENGTLLYYEGTTEDITARRRAEEALRASEEHYRLLFEGNPLPMWVYDAETLRFLAVNDAAVEHYGFQRDEFLAMTLEDIRPPEELSRLRARLAGPRQARERSGPWKHRKKDGTLIEVEISSNELSLAGRSCRLVLANDVTDRRQAEQATKQRLAELEAVNRISTALRTAQTLDEMLPRLLDETLAVLGENMGSIWFYDPASDEARVVYHRGWDNIPPPVKRGEDIPGHVIATGQAYISRDVKADPLIPESVRPHIPAGLGAACVPIRAADQVVGVLFANTELPHEFEAADVRLLVTIAEIAGNAIHRTRLHEQTGQQLERLAALRAIDEAISTSFDIKLTLNILLGHVIRQLEVDAASVLLFNPHLNILEYAAGQGFRTRAIEQSQLRLGEGYAGRAALERITVHIPDLSMKGVARLSLLKDEGFIAYHGVPLIIKGQILGVLETFQRAALNQDEVWVEFLEALAGQAAIAIDNAQLFEGLQRSNIELAVAYDATIEGWSRALDLRDKETEGHTQRVTELTLKLARAMDISEAELVHVRRGVLLHDIGKMGVPDAILLKPGKLTAKEWEMMRKHPTFAHEMLSPVQYLQPALDIPYCHHEKWDGTGYPRGLKGEQIPLSARIFAVVDVWDALRSDRPYRKAWSEKKVRDYLQSQIGKHFDPRVADRFLSLMNVKKSR